MSRRVLTTSRLRLRPFTLDDSRKLYEMSIEDGLRRWIPDQVYRDEQHASDVARALIAFTDQPAAPRVRPYVLGIEHIDTRELIGHVGLSAARGSVEIGYAIEDRHQGSGLATEAVMAMSTWGLAELELPEVLGIVAAANTASCRVLEKAGFVRTGEQLESAIPALTPLVVYRRAN